MIFNIKLKAIKFIFYFIFLFIFFIYFFMVLNDFIMISICTEERIIITLAICGIFANESENNLFAAMTIRWKKKWKGNEPGLCRRWSNRGIQFWNSTSCFLVIILQMTVVILSSRHWNSVKQDFVSISHFSQYSGRIKSHDNGLLCTKPKHEINCLLN